MIKHQIKGSASQMAVCQIDQGQTIYCEAGKFLWKTANVGIETRFTSKETQEANKSKGLLGKAMSTAVEVGKRQLAGESLAMQYFTPNGGSGLVSFAGMLPGEMRAIELDGTRTWTAEKDAFVAAEETVKFDIQFAGFKTGRRGGEGFVLEKFTGTGTLFVAGAGNFIDINPSEVRRQDPGRHGLRGRLRRPDHLRRRADREVRCSGFEDGLLRRREHVARYARGRRNGDTAIGIDGRVRPQHRGGGRPGVDRGYGRLDPGHPGWRNGLRNGSTGGSTPMGFMDKIKEASQNVAAEAKKATAQGKEKLGDMQAKKKMDEAAKQIGYLVYRERTEGTPAGVRDGHPGGGDEGPAGPDRRERQRPLQLRLPDGVDRRHDNDGAGRAGGADEQRARIRRLQALSA